MKRGGLAVDISIFEVLGPVMIGPSSSHTAGAARLARVAALIAARPFSRVDFGLSGSFARTCRGHGTNKALLAGAMGLAADDERIRNAEALAAQRGLEARFYEEDLDWLHENAAHITFYHADGQTEVWGASLGGGRIRVSRIGGFETDIRAECPTLVVHHPDRPGVVSEVSRTLAESGLNIAVMRLARQAKGQAASLVIEMDGAIPPEVGERVRQLQHVTEVIVIDVS